MTPEAPRPGTQPGAPAWPATTRSEVDTAAEILAAAFVDDPLFVTTLRSRVQQIACLPLLWRGLGLQFRHDGWTDLVERDGSPVGAAIWGDGMACEIGWADVVRFGLLRSGFAGGIGDTLRLMRGQERIGRVHHEIISEPHLYLQGIGVLPPRQGHGVGSELLDRGLAHCDEWHLPAYLETNLPQNARLYQRKGFQVVREASVLSFPTWFMLRPAR